MGIIIFNFNKQVLRWIKEENYQNLNILINWHVNGGQKKENLKLNAENAKDDNKSRQLQELDDHLVGMMNTYEKYI